MKVARTICDLCTASVATTICVMCGRDVCETHAHNRVVVDLPFFEVNFCFCRDCYQKSGLDSGAVRKAVDEKLRPALDALFDEARCIWAENALKNRSKAEEEVAFGGTGPGGLWKSPK